MTPKNAMYRQSQALKPQRNGHTYQTERQTFICFNHPNKMAEFKVET
jgi:hypothetical protein